MAHQFNLIGPVRYWRPSRLGNLMLAPDTMSSTVQGRGNTSRYARRSYMDDESEAWAMNRALDRSRVEHANEQAAIIADCARVNRSTLQGMTA